jgi:hypothetical protein
MEIMPLTLPDGRVVENISAITDISILEKLQKMLIETNQEGFKTNLGDQPRAAISASVQERMDQLSRQ